MKHSGCAQLIETDKENAHCQFGLAYHVFLKSSKEFETEVAILSECQNIAFGPIIAEKSVEAWCPEEDSNLHTLRHTDLNRARLPIPPSGHIDCLRARTLIAIG